MLRGDDWLGAAVREHLQARRTWGWAGALILLAAVLARVPLFDVLGFEFAFALAIAGSVASADLGAAFVRRLRAAEASALDRAAPPLRVVCALTARAIAVAELLLVGPALLIALNALWVRNCDWSFGLLCYLAMPALSAVLATVVGVIVGLAVPPRRRVLANVLPHAVLAASVLVSLWRFYSEPAVFSYNPFAGYFPGNLYDERIELGRAFWWGRAFHLGFALAALGAAAALVDLQELRLRLRPRPRGLRGAPLALGLAAATLASVLWSHGGALGFAVAEEDLVVALPRRFETEHFVIHYPPGGDIERDILAIAEDHEFRLAQATRTLGTTPPRKIQSFYFDSAERKHQLMGARNVYMAKPWREEIYLNHEPFPHQVLRHEIAHVVAGRFGDPIFRVSARRVLGLPALFNVGLIEGIAVAADWPDHFTRALTPHQSVKAMQLLGFAPPVERLLSTGFLSFSSARSYTAAGSFVRFLLDRHGAQRLQALYRSGGDFDAAYGMPLSTLTRDWNRMIEAIELPTGAAEVVRERFRRQAIFERPCPHAIARAQDDMRRLESEGRIGEAIEVSRGVCRDVPEEPLYRIHLADLLARAGLVDAASDILLGIADDAAHISSSLRAHSLVRAAGLAVRAGDDAGARALLDRADALPVEDDIARTVHVQRLVLDLTGPEAPPLRAYFWGDPLGVPSDPSLGLARAAEAAMAAPERGLGHYLLGRQLRGRGDPAATTRALVRALDSGTLGPMVEREAARLLAEAAYLAGDHALVERAAALLTRADQPEVARLYGFDWLERLHWRRTGEVPDPPFGPPATRPL